MKKREFRKAFLHGYLHIASIRKCDYFYITPTLCCNPKAWDTYRGIALRWGWWVIHIVIEKLRTNDRF